MNRAETFFGELAARERALLMGVLNVTPDSFSDGGRFADAAAAVAAGREMVAAGASLLDVGGESTRPGAVPVDAAEELARLLPVVRGLRGLPVSVDTRRAVVAKEALAEGACLVNDVSAGADPAMFPLVATAGAGIVLMHMRGEPPSMQEAPSYCDVTAEVEAYLLGRAEAAIRAGIPRDRILLDPGIGFGKSAEHNGELLRGLPRLASLGFPLVVGISRKRVLGAWTGRAVEGRDAATHAATALAARDGAAVVRVHEIAGNLDAVRVAAQWHRRSL